MSSPTDNTIAQLPVEILAEFGQRIIEGIAVVSFVTDEAFGLNFVLIPGESLLHHVGFGAVGGVSSAEVQDLTAGPPW